jgi:hypothetical protein
MRAIGWVGLVSCFLAGPGWLRADDQAEANALIDKALKALGGAEKVAKFKAGTWKAEITAEENGNVITVTTAGIWKGPDKARIDGEVTEGGKTHKIIFAINGDKGWGKKDDRVEDAPEGELKLLKEAFYALRLPHRLTELKDKDFTLSPPSEAKINVKAAVGFAVAHKDHQEVKLFFDKETGLPLKSEVRLPDPNGEEMTIEYVYSDFQETDGVKNPMKITMKAHGHEIVVTLSEIKPKDKVDESEFAKP